LFHATGHDPRDINADIVAISVVRDEMWRLPFFLAYHRWLGVQHFILIDNRSKDGTFDYLRDEPDVTCVSAPGDYAGGTGQMAWLNWAICLGPPNRWRVVLDADELLIVPALQANALQPVIRELNREGAAIAVASLVDCYPGRFPLDPSMFQPVPWIRAPYFDAGPYFLWPSPEGEKIRQTYGGARERLFWPHWSRLRLLSKVVPHPLRKHRFFSPPPYVFKMPLLRTVRGATFRDVHQSSGGPRSKNLFALLHYRFDIDLASKTAVALREKQHTGASRYYEPLARLLSHPKSELRFDGSRQFKGVRSLVDAELAFFGGTFVELAAPDGCDKLVDIVGTIWEYGDCRLQRQIWESAWGPLNCFATRVAQTSPQPR
jgi:hypothetical protein